MYKTAKSNPVAQIDQRRTLRNHATAAEAVLWRRLKGGQVNGMKFRRQHGMGAYVMDFYCPEYRLCIELDGDVHNTGNAYRHDVARDRFLCENGITVLRFKNEVVRWNIEAIVTEILRFAEGKSGWNRKDGKPPLTPPLKKEGNGCAGRMGNGCTDWKDGKPPLTPPLEKEGNGCAGRMDEKNSPCASASPALVPSPCASASDTSET